MVEDVPDLVNPVVIAAFEGWNDAADAASSVVDHLIRVWSARTVGAVDPEDFYDFQVNRPFVGTDGLGHRRLTWPSTQVAIAAQTMAFEQRLIHGEIATAGVLHEERGVPRVIE